MTNRWSQSRRDEWRGFCRALSRMGRALQRQKNPAGGYAPKRVERHPLLELVIGAPAVRDAIGDVVVSDVAQESVLSWINLSHGHGGTTLRLNHKGPKKRCQEALEAAIAAIRAFGRRVSYYDLIRHENQNGYFALLRVPDAPVITLKRGFAR